MKKGISIAGTIVADIVKKIERYPVAGMMTSITDVSYAVGGCVPNTLIDLAKIDPALPLYAYGAVGPDGNGDFIKKEMRAQGINVDGITANAGDITGFSDVMSANDTGERTFFIMRGANDTYLPPDDFLDDLPTDILHIGYILLMGALDEADPEYGTRLARLLSEAQKRGIRTSIDVVSNSTALFREKVVPALAYSNYAIMNEIEACGTADLPARDAGGKLLRENVEKAIDAMFAHGVKDTVIVHCPEAGFIRHRGGETTVVPSLSLPKGYIKGSVGAGDAFCAGALYGLYCGFDDRRILEFASAAAACNLSAADSVSGMRSRAEIEALEKQYPRREEI